MAGTAVLGRLTWQIAEVAEALAETPRVRTIAFDAPEWAGHRAGQHLDVRLTAEDGYQAQRSYSLASAPGEPPAITVERLEDGEVSPFLVDELRPGDRLELRGPIGGYFVWDGADAPPVLLVGGGSGIVPLMSMLRHRVASGSSAEVRLLYSSRTFADVIYRAELETLGAEPGIEVVHTLTRSQPEGWPGYGRRIDDDILREVAFAPDERAAVFVCGSTRFVDTVADGLLRLGYDAAQIRTERFGATGG